MHRNKLLTSTLLRRLSLLVVLSIPQIAAAADKSKTDSQLGSPVTVTDNGDGTVTMANGIVSIVIVKKTSRLDAVTYTYNNSSAPQTSQMLQGKGQYYYGGFMLGNGAYEYSLATDPAIDGGDHADVKLLSTSDTNGVMETHFSMLRGSSGYYSTAIMTHRKQDAAFEVGAWGVVTRVPPSFNWLSADSRRNFMIGERSKSGVKIPNAPHEITVLLDGSKAGEFADKFIYGQDHADLRAWGWSSVGRGGLNIGNWMMTTMEFSNGGPLKRDVSVYPYSELNNSILTGELGMGSDGFFAAGEKWTKTCGPWFVYMNNVSATISEPDKAAQALYQDALARAEAEKQAWPYHWFKHEKYVPASGRGTVKGKIEIKDSGDPNASAGGLWIGLVQQPQTIRGIYDFQKWSKPYQFFVQTDADGNFIVPHVLPGENYTLWAYGPGAAGTLLSQNQSGANPPIEFTLPSKPFAVNVSAGKTTDLGTVTWTPTRVGATVFELGYPTRKADKFRHGDDYWSPDKSPKLGYPTPIWGGQMYFPFEFPNGVNYVVGKSRWTKDWNYVLPSLPDAAGNYQPCTSTIEFSLAEEPGKDALASIYLGCAGDDGGHIVVSVNGTDLATAENVTAKPNPFGAGKINPRDNGIGGFNPPYSDDSSIHFGDHGPFSDERITFSAKMLRAGQNTITITMNAKSLTAYLMVDYLRLELSGYVPPAPPKVDAYAGNNRVLVCWPLVPGATSYNILRSTVAGGDFAAIATQITAAVAGSGPGIGAFADSTSKNGVQYFYSVQAVNPGGKSANSMLSGSVTPSTKLSAAAPAAPARLKVESSGHHQVKLSWTASSGADFYSVWRTTLYENGVGGKYPLRKIVLDDHALNPSFTDDTPSDGRIYSYHVEALNAAGTSGPSTAVKATPLPAPPASAVDALAGKWVDTRQGPAITLNWSPVPGAVGYVIYRSTQAGDNFRWPEDFVTTIVETTYTDKNSDKKNAKPAEKALKLSNDYYYRVTAVNAGGISPSAAVHVPAK